MVPSMPDHRKTTLNPKQEAFAQALAAGKGKAQAYRDAGFNAAAKQLYVNATKLSYLPKVKHRVDEILALKGKEERAPLRVTIDSVTTMLRDIYDLAMVRVQLNAAAQAALGIAKLHGLLVDKIEDVTRRPARAPDAPAEIELLDWVEAQTIDLKPQPDQSLRAPSSSLRALEPYDHDQMDLFNDINGLSREAKAPGSTPGSDPGTGPTAPWSLGSLRDIDIPEGKPEPPAPEPEPASEEPQKPEKISKISHFKDLSRLTKSPKPMDIDASNPNYNVAKLDFDMFAEPKKEGKP
jgi:hypothetical protein